jgi:hypothetical protein
MTNKGEWILKKKKETMVGGRRIYDIFTVRERGGRIY